MATGIEVRHQRDCRSREGGRCNCSPSYRASVWSAREGKRIRKTCRTMAEAKAWRHDASVAVSNGTLRAPTETTVAQAAKAFLDGARDGSITNRSGDSYKPATLRNYERALRLRVLPELGARRLSDVRTVDLQTFADSLRASGIDPSVLQQTFDPLRAIYRRALSRGEVALNPTPACNCPPCAHAATASRTLSRRPRS
jgi:integrase